MSFSLYVDVGELTSVKTVPYVIMLSTTFSIDLLIIEACSFSNPSSLWSDKQRASAFAKLSAWGMGSGKGTNGIICQESYFQRPTMLSNDNALWSSQSDLRRLVVRITDPIW